MRGRRVIRRLAGLDGVRIQDLEKVVGESAGESHELVRSSLLRSRLLCYILKGVSIMNET